MKIAIIVEGKTETAFMPILRNFLESRLQQMPKLVTKPQHGRIPKEDKQNSLNAEQLIGLKKYLNRGNVGAMIKHGMPKEY